MKKMTDHSQAYLYNCVNRNHARSQLKLKSAIARIRSSSAFRPRRIQSYRQCAKRATLEKRWTFVNLYIFYVFYIVFFVWLSYSIQFQNFFFSIYERYWVSRSGKKQYCSKFQKVVFITYFPSWRYVRTSY